MATADFAPVDTAERGDGKVSVFLNYQRNYD